MLEYKKIPCEICGDATPMLRTKLCLNCWELVSRLPHTEEGIRKLLRKVAIYRQPKDEKE